MPPSEYRLQRLVVGILAFERQVVAQDQAAPRPAAQDIEQLGQRTDVLAVDLHQCEAAGQSGVGDRVHGLHQRRLAHAARAPQHGVVRRQASGEAQRVVQQDLLLAFHALQQRDVDPGDLRHRCQMWRRWMPDEGLGRREIDGRRWCRCQTFQRIGDAAGEFDQALVHRPRLKGNFATRPAGRARPNSAGEPGDAAPCRPATTAARRRS